MRWMAPRTRPKSSPIAWSELAPEVKQAVLEGSEQLARGECAELSREETAHYIKTGRLPERIERWLDDYERRRAT